MREILFKGKRVDNGEWIEGQLLHFKASVGAYKFALIVESCEWDNSNEWFNLGKRAKVIPETVGQWTGLTDKNGKKIFEGDIVDSGDAICTVIYDNEITGFWPESSRGYELFYDFRECEVIGNIHDNPELLEVK